MRIVNAPLQFRDQLDAQDQQANDRVTLKQCATCDAREDALGAFKSCQACKLVVYCGKACQKQHWKLHKKVRVGQFFKSLMRPIV